MMIERSSNRRRLEPLEAAEDRYDAVMRNPASTWDAQYQAAVAFCRRAYFDRTDQDTAIKAWATQHPIRA